MPTNIFDTNLDLNKSLSKVNPLAAIWLIGKPIQTESERTLRISEGHKIRVANGVICDVSGSKAATHKVLSCHGNISNTVLYFELQDLETNELLTLNVK